MDAAEEAGRLTRNLPELWERAGPEVKHRLTRVMFQNIKTTKGSGAFLTLMDDEQIAEMKKTSIWKMRGPFYLVETGEGPSTLCTQAENCVGCLNGYVLLGRTP